jgi:hypothetical protein
VSCNERCYKCYGHLVYSIAISYVLWTFGIFCGHFGIFTNFLVFYIYKEKIRQPWVPCVGGLLTRWHWRMRSTSRAAVELFTRETLRNWPWAQSNKTAELDVLCKLCFVKLCSIIPCIIKRHIYVHSSNAQINDSVGLMKALFLYENQRHVLLVVPGLVLFLSSLNTLSIHH